MPKVPDKVVALDPFRTRTYGKDQSRIRPGRIDMPTQTEMMMAAAIMDQHGKLFVPNEPPADAPTPETAGVP